VLVGNALKTKEMSDMLLDDYNIYCQPINYPTVDVGTERLRFAPTPYHSDAMISNLVDSLRKVYKRLNGK
jgi:5-aminolevulinate synthase